MKQESIALKTLGIKARVYNQIRTKLYKKRLESFSTAEKAEFFDIIFNLNHEAHWELNAYKSKRKDKAKLHADRVARGYKFKKKTSLEDYKKSLVNSN